MKTYLILFAALFTLMACSESSTPQPTSTDAVADQTPSEPLRINAPAGQYRLDPYHASLDFSVKHFGVSNYVMRFTDFDVTVELEPRNLSASSVQVSIDPKSIRTDFDGDYSGTHPDSQFSSWDEDLAMSSNFLNADEYPSITFTSTRVEPTAQRTLSVTGDLQMLGVTKPVVMEVSLVGALEEHPFLGMPVIGFSATGEFKRSDFGMTHLIAPALVGDTVTIRFDGELQQANQDNEES